MSFLELSDIRYSYKNSYYSVEALKGISCEFERGKVYAIIGKSGSGKSTLLSLLAGLDLPSAGDIKYDGRSTKNTNLSRYRRENVSVIYQSFRLFPLLTAMENVMYPMELAGKKAKDAKKRAAENINTVGLDNTTHDRFPGMLSGGEQQRIAIARALSMNTKLILADEPTGNLDNANSTNIIVLLKNLAHNDNYCVVVVTHDLNIVEHADVVYNMKDGVLYQE